MQFSGNVAGGYSTSLSPDRLVTRNHVIVNGCTSGGHVYGGYSHSKLNASVTNNSVTLIGDKLVLGVDGKYSSIWGGCVIDDNNFEIRDFSRVVAGNTLNLKGFRGAVFGIYNFENYNWILPANVRNGDTLVCISSNGKAVNLTSTKHTISMVADGLRLSGGDTITMINKTFNDTYGASNYKVKQGQFIVYDATLDQSKHADNTSSLVLTVNG